MLKFTANRRLHTALVNMEAPMELINVRSSVFQSVIEDIKHKKLSPKEGAKNVLNLVCSAIDHQVQISR